MNALVEDVQSVRKKALRKLILIFFGVLAFLTFFSNTINNFTLPRVRTEHVAGGSLIREVTGEGKVMARESQYEYTQLVAMVEAVEASVGDRVKKGQVIMTLDRREAEQKLREASILLEKQRLTVEKLKNETTAFSGEAGDLDVITAKLELEQKESGYKNTKSLYNTGAESLAALNTAEYDLEVAQTAYEKALNTYREKEKNTGRELQEAEFDLELKKLEVDRLGYELENSYIIRARYDGIVRELNFREGTLTSSDKPLCVIINAEKGYEFNIQVDADTAEYLAIGDAVDVRIKTIGAEAIEGTIGRIEDSETEKGKKKELFLNIEAEGLVGNETGEVYLNKDIGFYDILASNNAVHIDAEGKFVWLVLKKQKPLGSEYYLSKAYVTVGEGDNNKTSLLSGIAIHDRIVTDIEENKSVSEGSRIIIAD